MELAVYPDEGSFCNVPNELLKQVIYYADVQVFEKFISVRLFGYQVCQYEDEEIKKSFLPMATLHLVNKRFKDLFLPMCSEVIKTDYEKNNYFPYQRYSFASFDFKKKFDQSYHEANILQFQQFVDDPSNYEKNYMVVSIDFFMQPHYKSLFRFIDPFYRLNYEDFKKWFKDEMKDKSSRFVDLIEKYIPLYRQIFSNPEAQDFNLFTLVALALISEGRETTIYYNAHNRIKLLTLFYQCFLHGPFPEKAKQFFLKKFIYQPYDFPDMTLKTAFTSSHLIEDYALTVYGYLCHKSLIFRICAYTLLKDCLLRILDQEDFLPKRDLDVDKVFLIRLYVLIFYLGNSQVLQDAFKNDFMNFFKKYDCLDYVAAIESVAKRDFDFWIVFELLSHVIDWEILKEFLKQYSSSPEAVHKQLIRIRNLVLYPNRLFEQPEVKAFLADLRADSYDKEFLKKHPFCLYFINQCDTGIGENTKQFLDQLSFLNTIVFSTSEKTGLKHEDIATTFNTHYYSNFYKSILEKTIYLKNDPPICLYFGWKTIKNCFQDINIINPSFCFSDGRFFFEKIFELDSIEYSEIQAVVLQKILMLFKRKAKIVKSKLSHTTRYHLLKMLFY